jgi:hypothetical protein
MRQTLLLTLILAGTATTVAAEPVRVICYAGTSSAKVGAQEMTGRNVVERTYDPGKSEIRQRSWSDKDPEKEILLTGKVDAKAGTVEFDQPSMKLHGTGKLDGKPWHWTSLKMTMTNPSMTLDSQSTMSDTKIHQDATMSNGGTQVGTVTGDLTAFDCSQLEAKKKELATPSDAKSTPKK